MNLNLYFFNVGPNLANSTKTWCDGQAEGNWNGSSGVFQYLFLGKVSVNEIRNIVTKTKNKTSTDCEGIDMAIVKKDNWLYK